VVKGAVLEQRRARLGGELEDVTSVRHAIGDWLREWDLVALVDDVELVASELITNAILHAGGDIVVVLERLGGGIRVLVRDGRPDLVPARRAPLLVDRSGDEHLDRLAQSMFEATTTGRGLLLVDAFADAWGVQTGPTSKEVWAELGTGRPRQEHDPAQEMPTPPDAIPVRVVGVPVRLVLLSAVNMDDLIREMQTTAFDAAAPSDLASLGERLVHETLAQREPLRVAARSALSERRRRIDVDLEVPPSQVAVLRHFVSLTDQVEQYCRQGVLLSQAPSHEVTAFRRWYVDELDRQVHGGAPTPCPFPD
jgi:anti-sigma regulatory factor (Ser/Thr protein kinase)